MVIKGEVNQGVLGEMEKEEECEAPDEDVLVNPNPPIDIPKIYCRSEKLCQI